MRWSLGRQLAAGFALPLAILAVVGGVAYRTLHHTVATSYWVEHTHEVLLAMQELYAVVADVESQHRTYVFTGDEASLALHAPLVARATEIHRRLAELVSDNPVQVRRVAATWASIEAKRDRQERRADIRRGQGRDAASSRKSRRRSSGCSRSAARRTPRARRPRRRSSSGAPSGACCSQPSSAS